MDRSPKAPHRPFQGPVSQVTPYVPYQNPHSRPESPYSRSFSSSGGNTPRVYGGMTPPLRPSSPSRHHRRTHSAPRPVKETLNAEFQEDDGVRRVNHYVLKREIGRGSFGVVHLGVDSTTGEEFAIKEFSKSKLRKRSQSMILRRTHTPGAANPGGPTGGRPGVMKRRSASDIAIENELADSLYLVRGEIAIMKKLNHENVVKLIEVLDDPKGDGLYMVIEYCKHGPVMDIGLDRKAQPYAHEQARNLFRDLLLGIEYLHAQGIVHRDIKPDNLLLDANDVLKIVDFGVSEMFTKDDDRLKSSSGSPAFASPELSVAGGGQVSGKAADIWAMGVTLYALIYGCLPFTNHNVLELYENIRHQEVYIPENEDPNLVDLFKHILDKDPQTRIKMPKLREHPWVTADGQDPLLSSEENTAEMVTHVTEKDYADAIKGIRGVMHVFRAVRKLKNLRQNSLNKDLAPGDASESAHRHTRSLEIDRNTLSPPCHHSIKNFIHDHLDPHLPRQAHTLPPPTGPTHDQEMGQVITTEPPLTPKIQVLAPPDEPSEDEIQYIGVGLGTLSMADKKRRHKSPTRAVTEPNLALHRRESSESIRSDISVSSGQLTPAEPMVYASPLITHENIFEDAFQRAEVEIRLSGGETTTVYNTWRSEEMRGQPVSNEYGRKKVELEEVNGDHDRPRWERVLKEKLPEKLAEIQARKGERMALLKESVQPIAEKLLGDRAKRQLDAARTEAGHSNEGSRVKVTPEPQTETTAQPKQHSHGWQSLLGDRTQKKLGAVKGVVESFKSGAAMEEASQNPTT